MNIFGLIEREKFPIVILELIEVTRSMGQARRLYAKTRERLSFWAHFNSKGGIK